MKSKLKVMYFKLRFFLLDRFIRSFEYSDLLFNFHDGDSSKLSRSSYDDNLKVKLEENQNKKMKMPSVSAIYRVKNGEEYIETALLSIIPLVTEIIVVDNNSTDRTQDIINRMIVELDGIVEIKLYTYSQAVELAGDGYLDRIKKNPLGSLSKFYDFSFSKGKSDYLIKCDAHCVFTLKGIRKLQEAIIENFDVIKYTGMEVTGKYLHHEPSLFKRNSGYRFIDLDCWEKLEFNTATKTKQIKVPVFIHLKRLSFIKYINCNESLAESKYN